MAQMVAADTDFTDVCRQKMMGYTCVADYAAAGWQLAAWREGQGRFFVELRGDRIFRFGAPSLAQAEDALLDHLTQEG